MRPERNTYPAYYENYIPLVKEDTIIDALIANTDATCELFLSFSEEAGNFAYAEGKWTIKEVLNHIIDTERIFAYRALRFARKDATQPLPFDQDAYVKNAQTEQRSLSDLLDEFTSVRKASISLFKSFNRDQLLSQGHTAAGAASVLAIGYTICGHALHHNRIVSERYLQAERKGS